MAKNLDGTTKYRQPSLKNDIFKDERDEMGKLFVYLSHKVYRTMLRKIRITLAILSLLAVTLLFLDFTGTVHAYLGWMAKIQFLPALLALNFIVVAVLILLTLLFGRVYCSVICPLGIMQDIFGWLGRRGRKNKLKYNWSPEKKWLRYTMLGVFIVALIAGLAPLTALLAPYSAYGRIIQSLFAPVYAWGNNLFAYLAERAESYAFYTTDIWLKGVSTLVVAVLTLVILAVLAWRNGRTYCNTVCPVGTVLSFFSRFAMFRPVIDAEKCRNCKLCEHKCKAACINIEEHKIDYSRCVDCFDCIEECKFGALKYRMSWKEATVTSSNETPVISSGEEKSSSDSGRRAFLVGATMAIGAVALRAQKDRADSALAAIGEQESHAQSGNTHDDTDDKKFDGGLARIKEKKRPERQTPIVPPGAKSLRNLTRHCTACQLCVSVCPNGVLRPSTDLQTLMQPESSYERGYCRPECVKCASVCPTGAIQKITVAEKSAIQIGHAVWLKDNCLAARGRRCDNCAHHCPTGAIQMTEMDLDGKRRKVPVVNDAKCIGCGACENLCPARPDSGIYVEGYTIHNDI